MIDAYGGFVRCGNCNYKFNIHDQILLEDEQGDLVNTGTRPVQHRDELHKASATQTPAHSARIEPLLERDAQEEALNIRFGPDEIDDEPGVDPLEESRIKEPRLDSVEQTLQEELPDTFAYSESPEKSEARTEDELLEGPPDEDTQNKDVQNEDFPDEDASGKSFDQFVELPDNMEGLRNEPALPEIELEAGEGEDDEALLFDSLHEEDPEDDVVLTSLINDDEQDEQEPSVFCTRLFSMLWRAVQFLFWALVAIALAYLLFGQIKDTLYPAYKSHALMQQARSNMCGYLPCADASYDTNLFEIVVSRMEEVDEASRQLHISIFLLNKAEQAQAYPNILLTLKSMDGSTVGQRVISPREYLTSYDSLISSNAGERADAATLVKPNKLGKILIKLDNPPADAVGFEARVVE